MSVAFSLQNAFSLFEYPLSRQRQIPSAAIDEILNHSDRRANALWTSLASSHNAGDGCGVFLEYSFGREGGFGVYLSHPQPAFRRAAVSNLISSSA